jgi:hypothetical protein
VPRPMATCFSVRPSEGVGRGVGAVDMLDEIHHQVCGRGGCAYKQLGEQLS